MEVEGVDEGGKQRKLQSGHKINEKIINDNKERKGQEPTKLM